MSRASSASASPFSFGKAASPTNCNEKSRPTIAPTTQPEREDLCLQGFDDVVTEALKYSLTRCRNIITNLEKQGQTEVAGFVRTYRSGLEDKGSQWTDPRWTLKTMKADFDQELEKALNQ